MNHIFLCGFNGFQQIQGFQDWLQSFVNQDDKFEEKSPRKTSRSEVGNAAKERDENFHSERLQPVVLLMKVGTLDENTNIQCAEMTWSRIGITVLSETHCGESITQSQQHTVICGHSSQHQVKTSQALQVKISDSRLLASNQTDFLLQRNDEFLLLKEDSDQTGKLRVTLEYDRDPGEPGCAHTFGAVSGTATQFVASYDDISVGKLSRCTRHKESDGSGDKDHSGYSLMLTCLDSGLSVQLVSCGREHSVFLTCHGSVLTCGSDSRGQLGHGTLEEEQTPRVMSAFEGVKCTYVAAGGWHSAAITECGELFMWGWNESGQLGLPSPGLHPPRSHTPPQHQKHPPSHHHQHPSPCQQPSPECHQQLHQEQQRHPLHQELQQQQNPKDLPEDQPQLQPSKPRQSHHQQQKQQSPHQHDEESHQESPPRQLKRQGSCERQQQQEEEEEEDRGTLKVCIGASLHLWPQVVQVVGTGGETQGEVVVTQVACGSRHTAIITESGEALTSGWNRYGQLGLPHTASVDRFTPVPFGQGHVTVTQAWCGAWNTLFAVKQLPGTE